MASSNENEALKSDNTGVNATPVSPSVHPRMFERIKLTALVRMRDILLAKLDWLIERLDYLCQFTDQFSTQAETTRHLRDQMACVKIESLNNSTLLDQIERHMAELRVQLEAVDPTKGPRSAA